jgi:hypothetical protein
MESNLPQKIGSLNTTSTRLYGCTLREKSQALLLRVPVSEDSEAEQRLDSIPRSQVRRNTDNQNKVSHPARKNEPAL